MLSGRACFCRTGEPMNASPHTGEASFFSGAAPAGVCLGRGGLRQSYQEIVMASVGHWAWQDWQRKQSSR